MSGLVACLGFGMVLLVFSQWHIECKGLRGRGWHWKHNWLMLARKGPHEEGLLVSTRLETHSPCCGLGSQKSTISATYTQVLLRTFWFSEDFLCHLTGRRRQLGFFGWVQIPLKRATISELIVKVPRPPLPENITLQTRIPFLHDPGCPLHHSGCLWMWRAFCLSLPATAVWVEVET